MCAGATPHSSQGERRRLHVMATAPRSTNAGGKYLDRGCARFTGGDRRRWDNVEFLAGLEPDQGKGRNNIPGNGWLLEYQLSGMAQQAAVLRRVLVEFRGGKRHQLHAHKCAQQQQESQTASCESRRNHRYFNYMHARGGAGCLRPQSTPPTRLVTRWAVTCDF